MTATLVPRLRHGSWQEGCCRSLPAHKVHVAWGYLWYRSSLAVALSSTGSAEILRMLVAKQRD